MNKISITALMAALLLPMTVSAGELDGPATVGSGMPTTNQIYDRLNVGADILVPDAGTFHEPAAGPNIGARRTLAEIKALLPIPDNTNGAAVGDVLNGKTFWGLLSGAWGVQSGTMPNNEAVIITPGTTAKTIAVGYHNGLGSVAGDANLVSDNIKSGATIFGVAGKSTVMETSTGTAAAVDILSGKTAFVNGATVTGTYPLAPVPKSGQTTTYATNDDGASQKGVAIPIPRFTNNYNDGTVTDNLTGLIWLQKANCASVTRTWLQALDDVASLNSSGTMNSNDCSDHSYYGIHQTDWRLPTVKELQSLVNFAYSNPALSNLAGTAKWVEDTSYIPFEFIGVQSILSYWSSSSVASTPYSSAWAVQMSGGVANYVSKGSSYYVWPVRGGQ